MLLLDRFLRKLVRSGPLSVTYAGGQTRRYGEPSPLVAPVAIRFTDASTPRRVALSPAKATGEAFMDGRLVIDEGDVRSFLHLVGHNTRWDADNPTRVALWRAQRLASKVDVWNWQRRSRRNVAHHYDLSDALYDLFLDADRQYSCAYFADEDVSLDQAQLDKKAHIAAKLALSPGQRVLDIGCGWGGMALYLNRVADVDVLGITLSEEQLKVARARAAAAGVAGRVRFELLDYRAVQGSFDRIVSVGMFEHVGPPHYGAFFRKCRELLTPEGVMLLHTIGRADGPGSTDPWTAKYIFPGGYVPALSQIMPALERSYLWLTDLEVWRLHYAQTLDLWYDRVEDRRDEVVRLYDERFLRMWQFYLAGAVSAFRNDGHEVFQLQLTRRRDALPIVRDYMGAAEAALARPFDLPQGDARGST
ncbi:class I SAM-dependent methyltransferase [Sphingomonas sp. MA1305]|uniref:SAM-dependent methyltransferase n=1 Tax=unclassified Sphingomonas TaxID=196159 RepID=UPI0018E0437C|nr:MULTISPECIES: cyclopropane-fatty-acyl-phospholipid synthase family protein [unclassified Sphingomonas]MBI0476983.1 class I SAM-dependent methyltransferase [Sphingomonas sp. MA1305]MCP4025517.1 class I SAM-dependent methyltransferase [Sphingomonas sp.]